LGPVFRAYDAERERLVAVKVFKLDLPPDRVHRLVAEFERIIAAGLTHPVLAAPLATGIAGVSAYLAQEYVAADSVDLVVREFGPAPAADALRVAAQLAGALDFAAAVHMTHGALHPRDVLLSSDDTRLTGIGIASALERIGVAAPVRRPYTAPERIAGARWDRRTDVFSLATLMHELLWAHRPSGVGAQAAGGLTEIDGGDLPALRATFARAMAEDPMERFPTALEFAEALARAFPGVTVSVQQQVGADRPSTRDVGATVLGPLAAAGTLAPEEPRLPLDEPADIKVRPGPPQAERAPVDPSLAVTAAEGARYPDVHAAPAMVVPLNDTDDTLTLSGSSLDDASEEPMFPAKVSVLDRSRRAVWLVLALIVGIAVGFAGGYRVGTHMPPDPSVAPGPTAQAPPPAAGREFTEGAVPEPAKTTAAAPTPPAAAPPPTESARASNPQSAIGNPQSEIGQGRLLVRSTPAGARVMVDGREIGRTPVSVLQLAQGGHRVRLMRDGYLAQERRVVITASRPSQSITVALEPQVAASRTQQTPAPAPPPAVSRYVGTLIVDSRPPGAKVYVDGRLVGTTPASLPDVSAGSHAIRLELDGYRRWTSSVRVVATEQNRVTASLER